MAHGAAEPTPLGVFVLHCQRPQTATRLTATICAAWFNVANAIGRKHDKRAMRQ